MHRAKSGVMAAARCDHHRREAEDYNEIPEIYRQQRRRQTAHRRTGNSLELLDSVVQPPGLDADLLARDELDGWPGLRP